MSVNAEHENKGDTVDLSDESITEHRAALAPDVLLRELDQIQLVLDEALRNQDAREEDPQFMEKTLSSLRSQLKELTGGEALQAETLLNNMLLKAASKAVDSPRPKPLLGPPYLPEGFIPDRILSPERGLEAQAPHDNRREFAKGNGSALAPYIWEGEPDIAAFEKKLRNLAVMANLPFVYGRDRDGLLEVSALTCTRPDLPNAGSKANPLQGDHVLKKIPYSALSNMAARHAIATGVDYVLFVDHQSTYFTAGYAGTGTAEQPYTPRPGQNEDEFVVALERIRLADNTAIVFGEYGGNLLPIHGFGGAGTLEDPFRPPRNTSTSGIQAALRELARIEKTPQYYLSGEEICRQTQLSGSGMSLHSPANLSNPRDLIALRETVKEDGMPFFYRDADSNLHCILPTQHCREGELYDKYRRSLAETSMHPCLNIADTEGKQQDLLYRFKGHGNENQPFAALDPDLTRENYVIQLRSYLRAFADDKCNFSHGDKIEELFVLDGKGTFREPYTDNTLDPRQLQQTLDYLAQEENRIVIGKSQAGTYLLADPFAGIGNIKTPYSSETLQADDLREQARQWAIFYAGPFAIIQVNGLEPEKIAPFEGNGSYASPYLIPAEIPDEFANEEFMQNFRESLDQEFVFIKREGREIELISKFPGLGSMAAPLQIPAEKVFSNYTRLQQAASQLGEPLFTISDEQLHLILPLKYEGNLEEFVQERSAKTGLAYSTGSGEILDPIRYFNSSSADEPPKQLYYQQREGACLWSVHSGDRLYGHIRAVSNEPLPSDGYQRGLDAARHALGHTSLQHAQVFSGSFSKRLIHRELKGSGAPNDPFTYWTSAADGVRKLIATAKELATLHGEDVWVKLDHPSPEFRVEAGTYRIPAED